MIKELCNHGLTVKDLEKQDQFGSTPLHFAALKNNENIVQLLVNIYIYIFPVFYSNKLISVTIIKYVKYLQTNKLLTFLILINKKY